MNSRAAASPTVWKRSSPARKFTDDDKAFIEGAVYFFVATADAEGRPDCSFKGGMPGFVRVTGPSELAFPDYDGNGMFKSLGNLAVNPNVGLLFIALHDKPKRLRINGSAVVRRDDPLLGADRRRATDRAGDGARDLSQLPALYPDHAARRAVDLCAAPGRRSGRAGLEGFRRFQGLRASAPGDGALKPEIRRSYADSEDRYGFLKRSII